MTTRPAGCGCYGEVVCRLCQRAGLPVAPEPDPCVHRGDRVYVAGSARDWRQCLLPSVPMGNPVCPCKGCGPRCPGYEASMETAD